MKGDIAMKKLDLISDEYIREAEIPEDLDVIVTEKQSFGKKLSRFINSPVGVAMLCAVVSLSVLAAIVMTGTGQWEEWFPPAGTQQEQESESKENNHENIPPLSEGTEFKVTRTKDHVSEFYQALIDQGMMGMIPSYDKDGELVTTDDPDYFFDEEDIYNVTPAEVYEQTGGMIFDTGWLIYLWHDGDIHIISTKTGFGTSFFSALPCDYDLNGTPDILYTYAYHLSGFWGLTVIGVYDTVAHQVISAETSGEMSYSLGISSPAVIYKVALELHSDPAYLCYTVEETSRSETEIKYAPTELVHVLHPSPKGLMLKLPDSKSELVAPVPPITNIPELVPTVFSQYMDEYGFVGDLSQGEYIDGVLGKFSYGGQPLNEMPITMGDGELPDGGFCSIAEYGGDVTSFSFGHISEHPEDRKDGYHYYLSTQTALEGFALPCGIIFENTFSEVLEKLSLGDLPPFTPGATVLYRAGGETLTVIWNDINAAHAYHLVFEESNTSAISAERNVTVTRKLTLSFGQDLKLFEVMVNVSTQYSTVTVQVPDTGELSPDVAEEIKQAFLEQNLSIAEQAFYSVDDLSLRYFGTYNGGFVVFVDGIFDYTEAFEYETVLGIEFEYSSGQKLLYYKDGRFYSLPEAAEEGHLSQADVQKLHEVYTQK